MIALKLFKNDCVEAILLCVESFKNDCVEIVCIKLFILINLKQIVKIEIGIS